MVELDKIYFEDCLQGMARIPRNSVDAIICDLPYGTTACSWDSIIPFNELWAQYERIIKPAGCIVLFSSQPFTTALINSNIKKYRYSWVWVKDNGSNFLNAKFQPMKITEDICVFSKAPAVNNMGGLNCKYYPQKYKGKPYKCVQGKQRKDAAVVRGDSKVKEGGYVNINDGERMPINVLAFSKDPEKLHPTQKPVDLLRYLVRTYTEEGEIVLDNCIGSGTTAIACIKEKRHFIGFENNAVYYALANKRISLERAQLTLF